MNEALQVRQGVRSAMRAVLPSQANPEQKAVAHNTRGLELAQREEFEAALIEFERAIACYPDGFGGSWSNRGNCLRELGRTREALASYDRAIAIEPDHMPAWGGRGDVLLEMQELPAALESFDRAIALQPTFPLSHIGRGQALTQMRRLDAAVGSFDRALALDPNNAYASGHKGVALLLNGRFMEGLRSFESRPLQFHARAGFDFRQPRWSGDEPLAGKAIALLAEKDTLAFGLGDLIQFCRYATLVAARGARVILDAPASLVRLLSSLDGVDQLVTPNEPLPEVDFWCPLLSLPFLFRTTLETIPASTPYLRASPERVRYWGERLGSRSKLRVGLVWAGGSKPKKWTWSASRDMSISHLAALKDIDAEFFSLQVGRPGEPARMVAQGWSGPRILDFTSELHDFAETAALIENLDLVISVDTSIAHLAGALGKPVWLLNRHNTCWRWMLDRDDSPWYPTMKIYRQQTPGDWDGVMTRVRGDLVSQGVTVTRSASSSCN